MVTFPYNNSDYAYALDPVAINFSSSNESYFTVVITIKYYEFYASTEKTTVLNYKIPLFNGVAIWYVGEIIQRNLSNLTVPFASGFQVKTALVTFVVKELALADDSETATTTLTDVAFIPGHKPKLISNNMALLHVNETKCRVTVLGTCYASFLFPTGEHTIKVYHNATEINSETITATALNTIYTKTIDVSAFQVTPADVFKITIGGTEIFKEFVIFPDTQLSNTLFFIDQYKLMTSLELTGEYSFNEDFEQLMHEYKLNNDRVLEVVETLEDHFLKINTGYILKSQVKLVNEIFKIKKAFLKNIEGFDLEMVPISKKRTGFDSENFLYSYDLEFRINKIADA